MKLPANKKRVPLNCLVRPDTKQEIQERAVDGKSQGDVIDEAISALYRETGTAYKPPHGTATVDGLDHEPALLPRKPTVQHARPTSQSRITGLAREPRKSAAERPFKGPLLKPKERKS